MHDSHVLLPLMALALLFAGCATPFSDSTDEAPPKADFRFSRLEQESHWMTATELPEGGTVTLALVDIDSSKPEVSYRCAAANCRPDGSGSLVLSVLETPEECPTLLALRDALGRRTDEPPFGLVLTAGGRGLGVIGNRITPEMSAFLRYFVTTLEDAGVRYAFIVPARLVVVRDPDAE